MEELLRDEGQMVHLDLFPDTTRKTLLTPNTSRTKSDQVISTNDKEPILGLSPDNQPTNMFLENWVHTSVLSGSLNDFEMTFAHESSKYF